MCKLSVWKNPLAIKHVYSNKPLIYYLDPHLGKQNQVCYAWL